MKRHLLLVRKRRDETPGAAEFLKGPGSRVPNISSEHFRAFVVLAEELNFTQAADKLHLSQATLNKRLTDLEEEFRFPLWEFTGDNRRGVKLTKAGRAAVEEIRLALMAMERACEGARAAHERSNNVLHGQNDQRLPRKGEEK